MLDILLILPPPICVSPIDPPGGISPPLGLAYLAAVLERAGYSVEILDMQIEHMRGAELACYLREHKPRVVGLSTVVKTYKNALRVAGSIKAVAPDTYVIIGGPQATFLLEETLACTAVDVVVRHEGEETILELMQYFNSPKLSLDQIRGIAFRSQDGTGNICLTPLRPLIADLDRLPLPARHLLRLERYAKPGVLITARGCPSHCIFCAANSLYRHPQYRARAARYVVDEIEELVDRYGLKSLFIADDTFTLWPNRAMEICDLIVDRRLKLEWTCEARINTMSLDLATKLVEAGCVGVNYGVETGNPDIMRQIHKGIHLEYVEEVVDLSQSVGLDVVCSFIIGFPQDTFSTVSETIAYANRLKRLGAGTEQERHKGRGRVTYAFTLLTPLPGTYIYDHAAELGIRFVTQDWDHYTFTEPVIETNYLSAGDMRQLYFEANLGRWTSLFDAQGLRPRPGGYQTPHC